MQTNGAKYYALVPELSPEDYAALRADIEATGVLVPVEYDEQGNILDGFHRVKACEELGIATWPRIERLGFTEEEKRAHARRLNLARRHLTDAQKRELIEAQLKETEGHTSDRQVAEVLGVGHATVSRIRKELEEGGQLSQRDSSKGADGKTRPRKTKRAYKYEDKSPEGEQAIFDAASAIVREAEKKAKASNKSSNKSSKGKASTKPPKPTEQQKTEHERLWRVLRALENIAEQDITPQEWLGALPDFMRDHLAQQMDRAAPWLETFLHLWRKHNAN